MFGLFNFQFIAFEIAKKMPNSEGQSSKAKKSKSDNFVWSDDEVELLLNVVLEYKTARTAENVDWQTCQTKYTDILDLFRAQYPSKENADKIGNGFDVTALIFTRLRRPHVTDIHPFKYFRTLNGVFKFTRFVWAIYPVTCGR